MSHTSNRLIVGMTAVAAIAGVAVWVTDGNTDALWAPVHTYLMWTLVREIDPDHNSSALIAGLVGGFWVLLGYDIAGALSLAAIMLGARLVTNTTGRRPLTGDLIVIGSLAVVASFTIVGWVAGFGLAIAIYVDDRMAENTSRAQLLTAALVAIGSASVAGLSSLFPEAVPDIRPLLVIVAGVLVLITVIREPEPPVEMVDSRRKNFISQSRLHASRSLTSVIIFTATLLSGPDATAMVPMIVALALVLISNEIERIRRR